MTARRLVLTAAAMAAIGLVLAGLAPAPAWTVSALRAPQRLVDVSGSGALVLAVVGGLAWFVWAWGVLGLVLTAVGAAPGGLGSAARALLRVLLPAGARRAAAVALGIGVALNGPLLAGTAMADIPSAPIPDWPAATAVHADPAPSPVPDWPTAPSAAAPAAAHVVVPGDCLWDIAAERLLAGSGRAAPNAEIVGAVAGWWRANATVIGPDPDLLLPGQVLHPPEGP
jgi:hypothetical protein